MLKMWWKMFKNQALTPTFRVEFHNFHKVFHGAVPTGCGTAVLFVKFKSEN